MANIYCNHLIDYLRHCLDSGQDESEILQHMTTQEIRDLDMAIDELQNYIHTEMEKRQILIKHQ